MALLELLTIGSCSWQESGGSLTAPEVWGMVFAAIVFGVMVFVCACVLMMSCRSVCKVLRLLDASLTWSYSWDPANLKARVGAYWGSVWFGSFTIHWKFVMFIPKMVLILQDPFGETLYSKGWVLERAVQTRGAEGSKGEFHSKGIVGLTIASGIAVGQPMSQQKAWKYVLVCRFMSFTGPAWNL